MIRFRKEHPVLRKNTKSAECGFPMISVHNGEPNRDYTNFDSHLIGIMYAGRNADDTKDDIVFYAMNAYWEPLQIHLPEPPQGFHWRVVCNTNCEYTDETNFQEMTEVYGPCHFGIGARTTLIFVAESDEQVAVLAAMSEEDELPEEESEWL